MSNALFFKNNACFHLNDFRNHEFHKSFLINLTENEVFHMELYKFIRLGDIPYPTFVATKWRVGLD